MIAVIAAVEDIEAANLVARWRAHGATLVTSDDLSHEGWCLRFPTAGPTFVGEGQRRSSDDLTAALVRLAAVHPGELDRFVPCDRTYAAAEMTAFLSYWLDALASRCRVVNRPSASCLLGPLWSTEQWLSAAEAVGAPTVPLSPPAEGSPRFPRLAWVTVIGDRAFGLERREQAWARALARLARVNLLGVGFACDGPGSRVATATLRPQLDTEKVLDALLFYLLGSRQ